LKEIYTGASKGNRPPPTNLDTDDGKLGISHMLADLGTKRDYCMSKI